MSKSKQYSLLLKIKASRFSNDDTACSGSKQGEDGEIADVIRTDITEMQNLRQSFVGMRKDIRKLLQGIANYDRSVSIALVSHLFVFTIILYLCSSHLCGAGDTKRWA